MLTSKSLKKYIETTLAGNIVNVELEKEDYDEIESAALDAARPYYSGVRYIQVQGPGPIDISNHKIVRIVGIEKTSNNLLSRMQSYMFGAPGIIVYDSDFRESYISYLLYQKMATQFEEVQNLTWKYVPPKVYISQKCECVLKCVVSLQAVTDIAEESRWLQWVKDYSVALAKIIVGRARSKYDLTNSQYQGDGNQLVQEGIAEKKELESQRIGAFPIM